jgi:hypothetical protein
MVLIKLLERSKDRACKLLHQISLFPDYFVTHLTYDHLLRCDGSCRTQSSSASFAGEAERPYEISAR